MRRITPLLGPAILIALWGLAGSIHWPGARWVAGPHEVVLVFLRAFQTSEPWVDLAATLGRVLAGVTLATLLGTALGLVFGPVRRLWETLGPALDFLRTVPPILTFPLFLLGLGYGEKARVATVVFGTFGIVALHVGEALMRAPIERTEMARLMGLSLRDRFLHVHLREALPSLCLAVRLALSTGLVIAIVTEMLIGARHGLGARALEAQLGYRVDVLWYVILLSGLLGTGLSAAVHRIERRLLWWR